MKFKLDGFLENLFDWVNSFRVNNQGSPKPWIESLDLTPWI